MPALTDADFDARVIDAHGLMLVDFWAPWCAPCTKLSPVVEAMATEHAPGLGVLALDIEAHPAAAARHAVLSLPTLILFRDGVEVERLTGTPSERTVRGVVAAYLG